METKIWWTKASIAKDKQRRRIKNSWRFYKSIPKFADSIKYIDVQEPLNIYSDGYNYYFIRTENGIPYYNNNINIYIDNSTGGK